MLPSDLIIQEGWVQGTLKSPEGRCILGALRDSQINAPHHLDHEIRTLLGLEEPLYIWNNDPDRTKEEVVAILRLAEINCGLRPVEESDMEGSWTTLHRESVTAST